MPTKGDKGLDKLIEILESERNFVGEQNLRRLKQGRINTMNVILIQNVEFS